ncbi:MAG: LysM peptidoglycan-binding domain-containing protein [Bacteroidota bacterium]
MASMKRGATVAFMLVLTSLIASACFRPASTPPSVTSTPINSNSLFQTPLGQPTNMTDVQNLATASALALSGTPAVGVATATFDFNTTPIAGASTTPTTIILLPTNAVTTPTATMALSVGSTVLPGNTSLPPATSVPGTRPATYTLQAGEFVYCIARRFNVDPDQTLAINGLSDGQTIYPGLVLKIPQSGTFPGDRMLQNHPTTYTVVSSNETLYSIACKFGDVDPNAIAAANNLSTGAALSSGQQLSIP